MKQNLWRNALPAYGLLIVCVLGCKLGGNKTSGSTENTPASNTNSRSSTTSQNIAGKYDITGTNPSGAAYKGTLEVIKHGAVYQFRWNSGGQYDGVGVATRSERPPEWE